MFNIGIIGSKSVGPLVKLTSRLIGYATFPQIVFRGDGQMTVSGLGYISGEWYVPGLTSSIGSSYQIRYTLQAGSSPVTGQSDLVTTAWNDIFIFGFDGRRIVWNEGTSGRVLVEIREKSSQQVKASAQFWASPTHAP